MPEEYLPFLLEMMCTSRESVMLTPVAKSFRQGWQEALHGETRPMPQLWEAIDAG